MNTRFFLDNDGMGNHFLIPLSRVVEWREWTDLDDRDEAHWEPPSYATKVKDPSKVTFENPTEQA